MRQKPKNKAKAPVKRNPDKTREKIFSCSFERFAKYGFYGTTLDEILKKAKVNKRMVYHYFGSKEGLYREIHLEGWRTLQDHFFKFLTEPGHANPKELENTGEVLLAVIRLFHRFTAEHFKFQRLATWDALEGGKVTKSLWKEIREPLFKYCLLLVEGAQEQGYIHKDLNPNQLLISITGMVTFYFIFENSLDDMIGKDPLSEKALQEREEELVKMCRKLMKNPDEK